MERKEGRGRPVAPKSQEQERGQGETEYQPSPSVWDILERRERLDELKPKRHWVYADGRIEPPLPGRWEHEERELNRLGSELREKGTVRDKLILELGTCPRLQTRGLSQREEFQQFRSKVEQMPDEEIAKDIIRKKQFSGAAFHPGVGLGEVKLKTKSKK